MKLTNQIKYTLEDEQRRQLTATFKYSFTKTQIKYLRLLHTEVMSVSLSNSKCRIDVMLIPVVIIIFYPPLMQFSILFKLPSDLAHATVNYI